ncbi:MAG: putative D,D-dipeptide-binding periplasmic protein DdpA [Anaerolineales bacterium]|nr:putative D,D-dipeptide-binding periplasmic protein DdpA [Anaerolineales bacterium]
MREPATQKLALEKGEIDIAWDLLQDQIVDFEGSDEISVQESPTFFIWYVGMNVGKVEAFADERVRDAVRYAIDYDGIVNDLMAGGAAKGQTFVPKAMFAHLDETPYSRDVEQAKSLMDEAGYGDGFSVEMITSPASPWPDIAAKIKEDVSEIGIDIQIKQVQAAQLYEIYRAQDHDMVLAQWGADYADPDALAKPFGHARTTGDEAAIKQLAWRNMYTNAETSDMVEQAAAERDAAEREQIYTQIQQIILDEGPFAIFLYPVDRKAHLNRVQGFSVVPLWYLYDLSEITIEE